MYRLALLASRVSLFLDYQRLDICDFNILIYDNREVKKLDGKKKLVRSYLQRLDGNKKDIFPLLCPVREKEWLQGWDYSMIYSESGFAEKGCVFETSNQYGSYRWIITKCDSLNHEIQFVKTNESTTVIIDIDLEGKDKLTFCDIQYTFIPLREEVVEQTHKENSEDIFNAHMKKWEDSLNYYLKHGEMYVE